EKDPKAVQRVLAQLREYFAGDRSSFNLPVDISQLTPFQRSVLDVACRIAPGQVWTYQRIAKDLGRPRSPPAPPRVRLGPTSASPKGWGALARAGPSAGRWRAIRYLSSFLATASSP